MQILAETTLWGEFIFVVAVLAVGAITFAGVATMSAQGGEYATAIGSAVVALLIASAVLLMLNSGPVVEYDAIVTDYNEVYAQGYEVVSQRGEITVLRKVVDRQ